jgi:hypothetical protein
MVNGCLFVEKFVAISNVIVEINVINPTTFLCNFRKKEEIQNFGMLKRGFEKYSKIRNFWPG